MYIPWRPSLPTEIASFLFCLLYLTFLFRRLRQARLDLYDAFMLSSVAIGPAIFIFVPGFSDKMAVWFGVAFPFVLLFSGLFVIMFLFVHRLTVALHKVRKQNRDLVQEVAILRQQMEEKR